MDQQITDELTQVLGRWVTQAASELEPDALNALQQCIEIADADVRIVVNLREGAIELQGVAKSAGSPPAPFRPRVLVRAGNECRGSQPEWWGAEARAQLDQRCPPPGSLGGFSSV